MNKNFRLFYVIIDLIVVWVNGKSIWYYGEHRNAGWAFVACFLTVILLKVLWCDLVKLARAGREDGR